MPFLHDSPIPQFLYLHYPLCQHVCSYCDFNVFSVKKADGFASKIWIETIAKHLKGLIGEPKKQTALQTLYLGGGTPSLLEPEALGELVASLETYFSMGSLREATIECNPESLNKEKLAAMKEFGFSRPSLGVQTFRADQLRRLERLSTEKHIARALHEIESNFDSYSLDLMIGIPDQDFSRMREDLARIREIRPPHLSVYILTLEAGHLMKTKASMAKRLVKEADVSQMYLEVCEFLKELGYDHYEISNFCLPGHQSVHNQNYWNVDSSYLALGPGAHGYFADPVRRRYENKKDLRAWASSEDGVSQQEVLTKEQVSLERSYLALRTNQGLPVQKLKPKAPIQFLEKEGLLYTSDDVIFLTEKGWLVLDHLAPQLVA